MKIMKPGIDGTEFQLKFDKNLFKKEALFTENNIQMIVIKVYKYTWWKKLLLFLGFSVKFYEVKPYAKN